MRNSFSALLLVTLASSAIAAEQAPAKALATTAAKPAVVAAPVPAVDQSAQIAKVEAYINSLTTISADFSQLGADGKVSKGKFYLNRPGKMRWQYDSPSPILLISDGKAISYYDVELDQLSYVDLDDTLAGFLAQKDVKLDSPKTKLTKLESANGIIRATMVQRTKPTEGSLTLEFTENPMQITKMDIVDQAGQTTHVALNNAKFGESLDKKLFIFTPPTTPTKRNR